MQLDVSKISHQDISSIHDIETLTGLSFWGAESYKIMLANEDFIFARLARTTKDGKNLDIGFVIARFIRNEAEIMKIAVHPKFQKLGVGGELLELVISESKDRNCRFCYLEVRQSNVSAMKFYSDHKFEVFGHRKNYYSNPIEDACVMRRYVS